MASKGDVQVIDDIMLMQGILDERMVQENDVARVNGEFNLIDLAPTVQTLSLSFKRIAVIENLVGFESLVKLCLDNNRIREIQNLGHLVNLRWLDLSFNAITTIKGLEKLTQLEDLSLYSNKIETIEGLDHCKRLQCLSLGNNMIRSMEQVKKLRAQRSLRMLTLSGNPIASEGEYRSFLLAYIDSITYLDYAMIDENDRAMAKEQYHDELLDTQEKEMVLKEKASREEKHSAYLQELEGAGILFAQTIFDELFADDADMERLKHLPNSKDPIDAFRSAFKNISEDYIRVSMERHLKRQKEIDDFDKSITKMRTADETDSGMLIDGYNKSKRIVADQITSPFSTLTSADCQRMVKSLQEELERVCDEMMNIEVRQVEKFETLVDEFENRLNEMKNETLEAQQLFFRAIEELEEKFSTSLRAVAMDLIDRFARDELDQEYFDDDEAMSLVVDKDTCMSVLTSSHDNHVGKIQKKEDEARSSEMRRFQECMSKYLGDESTRNRDRVLQVHEFSRQSKASLHALLATDDDDGFDDDDHGK
eukprot:gene11592-8262_t